MHKEEAGLKCYLSFDSNYMTFFKRKNYKGIKKYMLRTWKRK